MKKIKKVFSVAGVVLATSTSFNAVAGAVVVHGFDGNDNTITHAGDSISATNQLGASDSYSGNPAMQYSASGLGGTWYAFMTSGGVYDVTVDVYAAFSPGVTVWASGANPFNGGSVDGWAETSNSGDQTPSSFNATGIIGSPGTAWMSNGQGGNLIETLGYADSGPSHFNGVNLSNPYYSFSCGVGCTNTGTGWGEGIIEGAHLVSITDDFVSGTFSGSTHSLGWSGSAEMTFYGMQPGWYAVFVGGANASDTGGAYNLTISAAPVPEMETWAMMLAGIGFLGWRLKRQQQEMMAFTA